MGSAELASIPRYLQLARAIHERITTKEERELAVIRAAEAVASRKNEVIMRSVQEVIDFCNVLCGSPEIMESLDKKAEDITERIFSNRANHDYERSPILVEYEVPEYHVNLHKPEQVALTGVDNAHLHISFNPIEFGVHDKFSAEPITTTKHLFTRKYRITAEGKFLSYQGNNEPADPIADILTEFREKLGYEFFENILMPVFEASVTEYETYHHSSEN